MTLDIVLFSRLQFAFTISFHILFPAFSIGLSVFIAIIEGIYLKTKNDQYLQIAKFWTKVFALTFGMGVVSGIVMEFQLGTNWSGFVHSVGSVLGALFTYEVMTAFFIEAGFLGVMLFGWNKVSPRLHYLATLLVTVGTTLSAYWIMSANTWMQHPVGYEIVNNIFELRSWSEVVLNPFNWPRFIHMLLASYISAGFVICSVSGFYLLQKRHIEFSQKCLSFTWIGLCFLVPLQIFVGDINGLFIVKYQPIKTAAMEGLWETTEGAPFLIFAIPDQKHQTNHMELKIPYAASFINTHHWNGKLLGLKSVSKDEQPQVGQVFYSFRIMVYLGVLMLILSVISLYLRYKKRLFDSKWFLKINVFSAPAGFIALWCGWITAEAGRQPWIVYNLIKTAEAVSNVALHDVITSFVLIIIVYGIIFGFFYFYFLHQMLKKGPVVSEPIRQPFEYMYIPNQEKN